MTTLVVGGAGYIGSHMVRTLIENGESVVCFDDLSNGHIDSVLGCELVVGSLLDKQALTQLFGKYSFDSVLHFASFIAVGESITHPAKYYQNNVVGSINLLQTMLVHNVKQFIFSSTAAIFGNPEYIPIDENHPQKPINPYGMSKWMVEQILQDYDKAYELRSVCLRYFNAAGASPDGRLGERHEPETHLIPLTLRATNHAAKAITVFGSDYETHDGTCIRDYIHVSDLCDAHSLALQHLRSGGISKFYNLGNGKGYSVKEIIDTVKHVTGTDPVVQFGERRAGDPAYLVADSSSIRQELGWSPKYNDLKTIISHAWHWEQYQTKTLDTLNLSGFDSAL